jgi:MoaA/NifB/PqqE/SkfB family radical SAM enzyme
MGILQKIKNRLVISRQHSIIFEITQRCNLGCSHCYNVWKNHPDYPRRAHRRAAALARKPQP